MLLGLSACEEPGRPLPEGFASAEARASGRALFLEHCAICHGEAADGHGQRRQSLSGRPADFTDPSWSERTPPGRAFEIVRGGVPGTSMPAWKIFDEAQIWDLVSYLHSVATQGAEVAP
jgi:mono/diheme cytochrome c family protein